MSNRIAVLLLVLVIGANASEVEELTDCPQICAALFAPVCATSDNTTYSQFSNRCELRAANCRRRRELSEALASYVESDTFWCSSEFVENLMDKLTYLDMETPDCLRPCPMNYAPICVSNGQYRAMLSNTCLVDVLNCVVRKYSVDNTVEGDDDAALFKVLREGSC